MANKARKKKNNKNLIICICAAVAVAIIAIAIAVVFIVRNNNTISDDFFKSDDTKYVLTVDTETMGIDTEDQKYVPVKTHIVYTYSGDEITGMKSYVEYADADTAKKAFEEMKASGEEGIEQAELNGKYIIVTADKEEYEDMTASDVKQQIEFMEMLKNMGGDNNSENVDIEDIEAENTEEEE